ATRDMDKLVEDAVAKSLEEMKAACLKVEKELEKNREIVIGNAVSDLKAVGKDSLVQLEDTYDYSRKELSEKLTTLLALTKKLLTQEQQSLADLESSLKSNADSICNELRSSGADGGVGGAKRNPVEDAFADLTDEGNELVDELNRKVKDLLKSQHEAMSKL